MLTLTGQIMNVYEAPKGVGKDGKEYGGQHRVQILAENTLRNLETKIELVDLTVSEISAFASKVGQTVSIPVGVFSVNNRVQIFALPGATPS